MVRVGGLQMLAEQDPGKRDPAGMTPQEQLAGISRRVHEMAADQYRCFLQDLEPTLAGSGIRRSSSQSAECLSKQTWCVSCSRMRYSPS